MTTKFRIKLGAVELDYEGEAALSKGDILELMGQVFDQVVKYKSAVPPDTDHHKDDASPNAPTVKPHKGNLTTSDIAQKLGGKTGRQLVVAALTRLCIVNQQPLASRAEILNEMKSATAFYRTSFNKNLTLSLKRLVTSGKVHESGSASYSLSNEAITTIKGQLAK